MSPTPRAAAALVVAAVLAVVVAPAVGVLAALAVLVAVGIDARAVRAAPSVARELAATLSQGRGAAFGLRTAAPGAAAVRVRQALPADLRLDAAEADGALTATLTGLRRGRHLLPAAAVRLTGPLGLATWTHVAGEEQEVRVFPDLVTAQRLALAVRQGRFREDGSTSRGPLGLGTEFEAVREYQPDDDVRQINWRATARSGRPMSNQFRLEQDRDVVCLADAGRLMAAPVTVAAGEIPKTGLDVALDVVTAVCLVADEVGDRCGAVAFDEELRAQATPQRGGARRVVQALYHLEPRGVDADYELAFRAVGAGKRAFVLVLTDLVEEAAARPLLAAMPVLTQRHSVLVASPLDRTLAALAAGAGAERGARQRTVAATEVLAARERAAASLRRLGASVLEAPPEGLPAACVRAYLRAKSRGRL